MTDFQLLYLALVVIYLSDCVFWVRRGSVVMRSWAGRRCGVAHPSAGFGSTDAGMVVLNPLPPFGSGFVCNQWPLSMTEEGVCSFVSVVPNGYERAVRPVRAIRFEEVTSVGRDGAQLLINGKPFAKLGCEAAAIYFSRLVARLAGMPKERRGKAIEGGLGRSMNLAGVERRVRRFKGLAGPLWLQSHLVMVVLFGVVPLTIGWIDYRRFLWGGLAGLLGLLVINAGTYVFIHRRLFYASTAARWRGAFTMLFSPPAAIRVRDALTRDLLATFDPLAAGLVLCGEREREDFARSVLRDVTYPMRPALPEGDEFVRGVVREFHERYRAAVFGTVEKAGMEVEALLGAPEASDGTCVSYCPRCESQFVVAQGVCANCGGIELQVLGQKEKRGAARPA